jgi:hypothetical protein
MQGNTYCVLWDRLPGGYLREVKKMVMPHLLHEVLLPERRDFKFLALDHEPHSHLGFSTLRYGDRCEVHTPRGVQHWYFRTVSPEPSS